MEFSEPVERRVLHSRRVWCDGYLRSDGMLDIEVRLLDTRTHDLPAALGPARKAGEPLHQMGLRVTVDADMVIRAVESTLDHGPWPECPNIGGAYRALIGLRIGKGFSFAARKRFAGPAGCAHMSELLIPIATVAIQTHWAREFVAPTEGGSLPTMPSDTDERSVMLDSCYGYRSDGQVAQLRWPRFHRKRQE